MMGLRFEKDRFITLRDQDCKCIHKGLSQASCQGVHGLQDSDVHNTRRAMHFGKAMDEEISGDFICFVCF